MRAAFIYSDRWGRYEYGQHHPLKPVRLRLTYELLDAYGVLGNGDPQVIPSIAASVDEMLRFHSPEYLDVLRAVNAGLAVPAGARYGLGPGDNPIFLACSITRPWSWVPRCRRLNS